MISDAALKHNPRVIGDGGLATLRSRQRRAVVEWPGGRGSAEAAARFVVGLERLSRAQSERLAARARSAGGDVVRQGNGSGDRDVLVLLTLAQADALVASAAEDAELRELAVALREALIGYCGEEFVIPCPKGPLKLGARTLVMGVLNVTPDSFSDGGQHFSLEAAVRHGLDMVAAGADIVDVGGESTRPGAEPVSEEEEIRRVTPVIEALVAKGVPVVSIDTCKPVVAAAALDAGAQIVNDVNALRDEKMVGVVARRGVPVILMHMQGTPRDMQRDPTYGDVVAEILAFLRSQMALAARSGIAEDRVIVDPGIGFGKTVAHNLEILRRLDELRSLGRPMAIGTSRKSFIGHVLGVPVRERLMGTATTVALAVAKGAKIVRVHDVREAVHVVKMCDAIRAES